MGGDDQPLTPRSMGTLDVQAMPGFRMLGFMPGIMLNLRLLGQLSGDNSAGNEVSGSGSLLGVGVAYEPGPVKLIGSYDLRARHTHSLPDTSYQGSGFTFLVGLLMMPGMYIDLQFNRTSYDTRVTGAARDHLGTSVVHWNAGFGLSMSL